MGWGLLKLGHVKGYEMEKVRTWEGLGHGKG